MLSPTYASYAVHNDSPTKPPSSEEGECHQRLPADEGRIRTGEELRPGVEAEPLEHPTELRISELEVATVEGGMVVTDKGFDQKKP